MKAEEIKTKAQMSTWAEEPFSKHSPSPDTLCVFLMYDDLNSKEILMDNILLS